MIYTSWNIKKKENSISGSTTHLKVRRCKFRIRRTHNGWVRRARVNFGFLTPLHTKIYLFIYFTCLFWSTRLGYAFACIVLNYTLLVLIDITVCQSTLQALFDQIYYTSFSICNFPLYYGLTLSVRLEPTTYFTIELRDACLAKWANHPTYTKMLKIVPLQYNSSKF